MLTESDSSNATSHIQKPTTTKNEFYFIKTKGIYWSELEFPQILSKANDVADTLAEEGIDKTSLQTGPILMFIIFFFFVAHTTVSPLYLEGFSFSRIAFSNNQKNYKQN